MSLLDRVLDRTNPFEQSGESWADKQFGVRYCMECGERAEEAGSDWFTVQLVCPTEGCSIESARKFRTGVKVTLWAWVLVSFVLFRPLVAAGLFIAVFYAEHQEQRLAEVFS